MNPKNRVLVIEDEDEQRLKLIKALRKTRPKNMQYEPWPEKFPEDEPIDRWVTDAIRTEHPPTLLDLELTRLPDHVNSEALIDAIYDVGGFCVIYTSREDGRRFEFSGKAAKGGKFAVVSKKEPFDTIAKEAWNLIEDYANTSRRIQDLAENLTPSTAVVAGLKIEDNVDLNEKAILDTWFSTLISQFPGQAFSNEPALDRQIARRQVALSICYWLHNQATFFPGVLAHDEALASYLGIPADELDKISGKLKGYMYKGPFTRGRRFWFIPPLYDIFGQPGQTSADKFRDWISDKVTSPPPTEPAGYYCPINKHAVSEDEAQLLPGAPRDALLTRTTPLEVARLRILPD